MATPKININSPEFIVELVKHFGSNHIKNLEETYQQCENRIDVRNENNPKNCVGCNLEGYDYLYNHKQDTSYHCQQENFIYAIRTMPCHADELYNAFFNINNKENQYFAIGFLSSKKRLNIASIGFGCGTDVLAILKILNQISICNINNDNKFFEYNQIQELNVLRIDDQAENWQQSADAVLDFIENNGYIKDNFDFLVTEDETDFIENTDIFIMSYVYNELNQEEKNAICQKISHLASKHFLIIVNDYDGAGHNSFEARYFNNPFNKSGSPITIGNFDYKKFGFEKINSGEKNWDEEKTLFKKTMDNISLRSKYAMKTKMKSICYIFEFKRIEK